MEIGKKIRKIRELRDLTQEYLAGQLGICVSAYRKIESDETDAKWSRIVRIADLLNVTPVELIAFDSDNPFSSTQEQIDGLLVETVVEAIGVSNKERELYEGQIELLKVQVEFLHGLHRQAV